MFEYHGWVTVRESADAEDEDDHAAQQARPRALVAGIDQLAREAGGGFGAVAELRRLNGEPFLHLAGYRNHPQPAVPALFREVGRRAPGSYGLLYVRDDEDPVHPDGFAVHRMARGRVTVHRDALLSPCTPVLEDPWPG